MFKTVNSVFLENEGGGQGFESPDSCSTNTSTSASFPGDSVEVLEREMALSEDRWLFFEPGENKSSSILSHVARTPPEKGEGKGVFLFNGSAVELAVESTDPYNDFRRSMEEMVVESHGLEDWDCLAELLSWYLRVNGNANHGLIIDAFIEILISLSPNCVVP